MNIKISKADSFADLQKCFCVRSIVFCDEQQCPYSREIDGLDFEAVHFLGTVDGEPAAAARIRLFGSYAKIERLAVRKEYRGKGAGKELFAFILNYIDEIGYAKIILHAQAYIVSFYENFGFVKYGEKFMDVNIEHYCMEKHI
jgi:predicted GNAT family N-acyltransferase